MTVCQINAEFHTVSEVLRAAGEFHADVEAYVEPAAGTTRRRALTYRQWDRAADGVAGLFSAQGVTRGTVVCLILPSSIDYIVCYTAACRLGAITSGINPRLGTEEVRSILERTKPAVTVLDDAAFVPDGPTGRVLRRHLVAGAASGPPPTMWPEAEPTDPVAVVWTSGTTGLPKGAIFDHRRLAAVAAGTDVLCQSGDRRLSPLPFAHVGSMTRIWDEIVHGITTVITPSPWRAGDAIAVMADEQITVAQGVPTQWALVMDHPDLDSADLSALRVVGTGGSRVSAELVAAMRQRFGVPVVVRYTSTEASLGTGTDPGDSDVVVATTVGRPVPGVSLAIVDGRGATCSVGEIGRVTLRSAAAMLGYWGRPPTGPGIEGVQFDLATTGSVLDAEGWITTGDSGFLDEEGHLHLAGRADEMYIRGGYNIYPSEIEAVLASHPDIAEVAVVGASDPILGEIGVAFVVPATGAGLDLAGVRAWVGGSLADYKAPDRLVLVSKLPVTPMMKVDRRALGAAAAEAVSSPRGGCPAPTPPLRALTAPYRDSSDSPAPSPDSTIPRQLRPERRRQPPIPDSPDSSPRSPTGPTPMSTARTR